MNTKTYEFGSIQAMYVMADNGRCALHLLTEDCKALPAKNWELGPGKWDARSAHIREYRPGTLVQLHLSNHARSRGNGTTMKCSESTDLLTFDSQWSIETEKEICVVTRLTAREENRAKEKSAAAKNCQKGKHPALPSEYEVEHRLTWVKGTESLYSDTKFINTGKETKTLEFLTSFCLENLSPYQLDNDQTDKINLHRFYGGWALEGKHVCIPIEELGLQKAWGAAFTEGERFGSVGSWTTHRFFPTAAVEDKENKVLWGATLETVSSWQMELTRDGDTLSFSGGLADAETGDFRKNIAPGESFQAPRARITVVCGDIQDACQSLLTLQDKAYEAYGEPDLAIAFNEYCSSWGNPTQEKELQYAKILENKGIRYFVIDAGWSRGSHEQWGNGEWIPDEKRFPDMKTFTKQIRQMGMIPGIWFEFEVTTEGSRVFSGEYDHMHLKRNGEVICFGKDRSFWDFRNQETVAYLQKHVIDFLKEYDFGYLKVDYNGNIGLGCDGAESLGEGLRQQMEAVKAFFVNLKEQIPDIIIENCASGGHRLESSMMSVTALSSFSDCHEAVEIPYIAGNVQNLCIPAQNSIWAVLRKDDTLERVEYSIAAGMLGRLCLSGDIENLSDEQWNCIEKGISLYKKSEHVLKHGTTRVYRTFHKYIRHCRGIQVVTRRNEKEMLLVYHGFLEAEGSLRIPLESAMEIVDRYGHLAYDRTDDEIIIKGAGDYTAGAIYIKMDGE